MKFHALIVDDNSDVLDDAKDRLESLGHTCHCVTSLSDARDHLAKHRYSHAVVDLEIPVRYGRPSRIENGKQLVRQIRAMPGYQTLPIIVITGHGDVPILQCLRTMKKAGYEGVLSIEFEGMEDPLQGIAAGLENLRRLVSEERGHQRHDDGDGAAEVQHETQIRFDYFLRNHRCPLGRAPACFTTR